MKQTVFTLITALSLMGSAYACDDTRTLPQYSDVKTALLAGKSVSVLLELGQCINTSSNKPGPKIQSGLRINSFMIPGEAYIAFSDVHETLSLDEKLKQEHIRYSLTPDDKLTIRTSVVRNGVVTLRGSYTCSLGAGARFVSNPGT